jgi:hypothetical protein
MSIWPTDDSLPRNHEGKLAGWQEGRFFTQGQASEFYPCGERGPLVVVNVFCADESEMPSAGYVDYLLSIGVATLDDGTFLAWHGLPDRNEPKPPKGRTKKWGGFAVWNRRYPTRSAALRSNAAHTVWLARKQFRLLRGGFYQGNPISQHRYRDLVAWAFAVAGSRAPVVYIAPPPPPPIVKAAPDRQGQLGFAI